MTAWILSFRVKDPQLARFFYAQALEERDHAMMMVQYLIDADERVVIPGVVAPQVAFEDIVEPIALALEQEKRVSEQIGIACGLNRQERRVFRILSTAHNSSTISDQSSAESCTRLVTMLRTVTFAAP